MVRKFERPIIPLREIIGNYNRQETDDEVLLIIPLREIIGNYNQKMQWSPAQKYYTLERDNRELQHVRNVFLYVYHYTLERDNRELQRESRFSKRRIDYTLERDNRELQHHAKG